MVYFGIYFITVLEYCIIQLFVNEQLFSIIPLLTDLCYRLSIGDEIGLSILRLMTNTRPIQSQ